MKTFLNMFVNGINLNWKNYIAQRKAKRSVERKGNFEAQLNWWLAVIRFTWRFI